MSHFGSSRLVDQFILTDHFVLNPCSASLVTGLVTAAGSDMDVEPYSNTVGSRLNMPLSEPLALTPLTVPHVDYHQLQAQHLANSQFLTQTEKDARDEIIMDQLSKEMGAGIPEVEDGTMDFYAWLCCNW